MVMAALVVRTAPISVTTLWPRKNAGRTQDCAHDGGGMVVMRGSSPMGGGLDTAAGWRGRENTPSGCQKPDGEGPSQRPLVTRLKFSVMVTMNGTGTPLSSRG